MDKFVNCIVSKKPLIQEGFFISGFYDFGLLLVTMVNSFANLEDAQKALVYVATLGEEENAFELFRFLPSHFEKNLVESTRTLLSLPKEERKRKIIKDLKQFMHSQKVHLLNEIHPGWFLEMLKDESPKTVGLILRYLPGDKVTFILENIGEDLKNKLPKLNESKNVPDDLLSMIRDRFESHFATFKLPKKNSEISIQDLYFIKTDVLLAFFRDLGVEQLARAFKGLDKVALKAMLNRLTIKDAKQLQASIKSLEKVSKKELSEAQILIIDLPIDRIDPEALFLEVGMAFFARAISPEQSNFVRALQFKLPPKYGYLLKRYVEESIQNFKPRLMEGAKKRILARFHEFPSHS